MEIELKPYVQQEIKKLVKDRELSTEQFENLEKEIDGIVYIVENRLDSAIYEMFEEVINE